MLTLAMDSAAKTVSLALLDEEEVRAELTFRLGRHLSEVLLPALEQLFLLSGLTVEGVDLLACTVGPGSFTGLRIGVSTVKGLALAMGKPVVGVSTLEALAMNAMPSSKPICPMIDAGRNQVYAGLFRMGPERLPEAVIPERLTDVAAFLQVLDQEDILVLGDGAARHAVQIGEIMGRRATLCDSSRQRLMATAVGLIGRHRYRNGQILDTPTFAPRYLRLSDAETKCEA